jgi:hypothetical protein
MWSPHGRGFGDAFVPVLLTAMVAAASSANATQLQWSLYDVTFSDGGIASGTFSTDSITGSLVSYDITTTSGTSVVSAFQWDGVGDFKYGDNFYGPYSFLLTDGGLLRFLNFSFQEPLNLAGNNPLWPGRAVDLGSSIVLQDSFERADVNYRLVTAGYAATFTEVPVPGPSPVPEPTPTLLLGSGLLGLTLRRRRR